MSTDREALAEVIRKATVEDAMDTIGGWVARLLQELPGDTVKALAAALPTHSDTEGGA